MSEEAWSGVVVRPARADDAEAIAVLSAQLGYAATGADVGRRLAEIASEADATVLVADSREGGVVGWVHVSVRRTLTSDACAEIGGLIVGESCRRQGIGARLMHAAEEWAKGRRLTLLRLRSNIVRADAHAFYRRQGFAESKTSLMFTKAL